MATHVTPDTLERLVEFNVPFVLVNGDMSDINDCPPDVYMDEGHAFFTGGGWEFYSRGYTAQWGVMRNDPVMHPSEYLGGKLARDMIDDGGVFAVVEVRDLDDEQGDFVGWTVLRKVFD
jgi:hypothetical protein